MVAGNFTPWAEFADVCDRLTGRDAGEGVQKIPGLVHRVEGKAKSGGIGVSGNVKGLDFGTDGFSKTPLGKATQIGGIMRWEMIQIAR